MEVEITQDILNEVNTFINSKIVKVMNDNGLSFPAMGFIIQSLFNAIDEAQTALDREE
jgi:hypothetical protein